MSPVEEKEKDDGYRYRDAINQVSWLLSYLAQPTYTTPSTMGTVVVSVELAGLSHRADLSLGAHDEAALSVVLDAGIRLTISGIWRIRPSSSRLNDLGLDGTIGFAALFSSRWAGWPCCNRDMACLVSFELRPQHYMY